jgi:hypothetical protein
LVFPRISGHAAERDPQNDRPGNGPDREFGVNGPFIVCHSAARAAFQNERREALGVKEARTPEIVVAHRHVRIDACGLQGHLEGIEGPRIILADRELALEDVKRPSTRPTTRCRTRNITKVCTGSTS